MAKPALNFIFYIAAPPEKVWESYLSPESNRILFMGADLQADLKPGGALAWVGKGTRRQDHSLRPRQDPAN